jgi:hypothetical protein
MRIRIDGECDCARDIRSSFGRTDIVIGLVGVDYTLRVEEADVEQPILNGLDCELERRVANCIEHVAKSNVVLDRLGDIRTDAALGIKVPAQWNDEQKRLLRDAVCRAMQQMAMPNPPKLPEPQPEKRKWWKVWE